jgi:hypothetical protein
MTLEDVGPDHWRHCVAAVVEMTLLKYASATVDL